MGTMLLGQNSRELLGIIRPNMSDLPGCFLGCELFTTEKEIAEGNVGARLDLAKRTITQRSCNQVNCELYEKHLDTSIPH